MSSDEQQLAEYRDIAARLQRTLEVVLRETDPRKARQLLGVICVRTSKYMTG